MLTILHSSHARTRLPEASLHSMATDLPDTETLAVPEFCNEENAPLIRGGIQDEDSNDSSEEEPTKAWDAFQESLDEASSVEPSGVFKTLVQLFKALVYLVTFGIVLASAVVSKGTLLLMTSLVNSSNYLPICNENTGLEHDKTYLVRMSTEERRGWIWSLILVLMVPDLLTFIRSCRICIFKTYSKPQFKSFLTVLIAESLHVIGLGIMVFAVLPRVHVFKGLALTCAVSFVPSVVKVTCKADSEGATKTTLDVVAVLFQASGLLLWPILDPNSLELWLIPLSLLLVSCAWWENFVDKDASMMAFFVDVKMDFEKSRHFTYVFISVWKASLLLAVCLCICHVQGEDVPDMFAGFADSFRSHPVTVYWQPVRHEDIPDRFKPEPEVVLSATTSKAVAPVVVALAHAASSFLCYSCGKFGCKIGIQRFSYALPLSLVVPVAMSLLVVACGEKAESSCCYSDVSPYLYWDCPKEDIPQYFLLQEYGFAFVFWLLSHAWITIHVWSPKCERLASTNKLFVNPMYCTAFIDQSLALNRRIDEDNIKTQNENEFQDLYESSIHRNMDSIEPSDTVPRIYACATMWHETPDEMELLLKSIMRMDADQCARKNAAIYLKVPDPDFYYLEAHIFFDDAFVISDDEDNEDDKKVVINSFVKDVIQAVDAAACKVHETQNRLLSPPTKISTPYGGRLVWRLPGNNNLIVHLKNKNRIRHKKRWSQCMYMYYLLGYCLMSEPIAVHRKSIISENTYILALDGDIDFKPDAVQLLVDLMNRNKGLGAACGRIHPVGTGLMVYYQKFEYAIGHWLQKATEHMIGCVLCSPGCFSLFRAKALMDDNVVRKYTTKSKEAIDYVQFDQGEDRWLCTLLLQRGYRVEYSAASDAYTHCPETFAEFYTQRRRWAPSTMANIMDLLVNYRRTVAVNDNISLPYIAYQVLLMIGTILGPGTIFLMLVGAMVSAFGISNWQSFAANILPVTLFILICFFAKNDTQILVAQIFSAAYALLMMAVLVGIALQLAVDGITSPSAIFLLSLTSSFIIAAIVHPQEFWCVAHGLLYFLSVPSMYLLLALYSIVNLNVVSWGTREVQTKKSKKQMEAEKAQQEQIVVQKVKSNNDVFSWIAGLGNRKGSPEGEEEGGVTFGLANLFRCSCCAHQKPDPDKLHMVRIGEQLDAINQQMHVIQRQMDGNFAHRGLGFRKRSIHVLQRENLDPVEEGEITEASDDEEFQAEPDVEENACEKPDHNDHWLTHPALLGCPEERLDDRETTFWTELIDAYLLPLPDDTQEQEKAAKGLLDLRNKVVFGFLMLNALFILIVFLLQMQKDTLHVNWPLSSVANITYMSDLNEVLIDVEKLQLEPINLILAFFFTLILVIQFVAMLLHRMETMSHILASTELELCCGGRSREPGGDELLNRDGVQIARVLQELKPEESKPPDRSASRRGTVHMMDRPQTAQTQFKSLSVAFAERYKSLTDTTRLHPDTPVLMKLRRLSKNPETLEALKRRATVHRRSLESSTNTLCSTSDTWQMRRLDAAFGSTPGGSVRSSFYGSDLNDRGRGRAFNSNFSGSTSSHMFIQGDHRRGGSFKGLRDDGDSNLTYCKLTASNPICARNRGGMTEGGGFGNNKSALDDEKHLLAGASGEGFISRKFQPINLSCDNSFKEVKDIGDYSKSKFPAHNLSRDNSLKGIQDESCSSTKCKFPPSSLSHDNSVKGAKDIEDYNSSKFNSHNLSRDNSLKEARDNGGSVSSRFPASDFISEGSNLKRAKDNGCSNSHQFTPSLSRDSSVRGMKDVEGFGSNKFTQSNISRESSIKRIKDNGGFSSRKFTSSNHSRSVSLKILKNDRGFENKAFEDGSDSDYVVNIPMTFLGSGLSSVSSAGPSSRVQFVSAEVHPPSKESSVRQNVEKTDSSNSC